MKSWQAAKIALTVGAPLDNIQEFEDNDFLEEIEAPQSRHRKLIHPNIPYTYNNEVDQIDGEIHSEPHRPNHRLAEISNQAIIRAIDESIMWQLKPLEDLLERLYLLRDIRNELYYLNNSEEI